MTARTPAPVEGATTTTLTLTAHETEMLHSILEEYLGELRMEVAGTDSMDFREMLKEREVFVKKLLIVL